MPNWFCSYRWKVHSEYSLIASRQAYGHRLFAELFNNVFAQRSKPVRATINSIAIKNFKSYDENFKSELENKIVAYYLTSLSQNGAIDDVNIKGNDSISFMTNTPTKNKKLILGILTKEEKDIQNALLEQLNNSFKGNGSLQVTVEQFELFNKLTFHNQIRFIKTSKVYKDFLNRPEFRGANIINLLDYNSSFSRKTGYDIYKVIADTNSSVTNADIIASVHNMLRHDNPFINHVVRNMIAYTYFTSGFNFGYNIGKYLDTDILTKDIEAISYNNFLLKTGINDPIHNIGSYKTMLEDVQNYLTSNNAVDANESLETIYKQNSKLAPQIPPFKKQADWNNRNKSIATFGFLKESKDKPNLGTVEVVENGKTYEVIIESESRILNSYAFRNEEIIAKDNQLYKRSSPIEVTYGKDKEIMYIYYPIGSLMYNEYAKESIVPLNNTGLSNPDNVITELITNGKFNKFITAYKKDVTAYNINVDEMISL